jgi:hypothetical protein
LQVDGTVNDAGSILFFPPKITVESGKKGQDYYDRIRTVIDRVLERRNDVESKIADKLISKRGDFNKGKESPIARHRPRRAAAGAPQSNQRPSLPGAPGRMIDLSWKDGGTSYPKRSSRVGDEYQATELPKANQSFSNEDESNPGSDF